jgi:hypothetical protein
MADLPVISATTPTTIPPVDEKVYDRWWMSELRVSANDPNSPIVTIAKLQKSRSVNGVTELSPVDNPVYIRIDDTLSAATTDANLAQVVGTILAYVAGYGQANSLI